MADPNANRDRALNNIARELTNHNKILKTINDNLVAFGRELMEDEEEAPSDSPG